MAEIKPWDQRKGEPDSAYSHFLIYRNLGPARSIDAAYFFASESAPKRAKTRHAAKRASGTWKTESDKFDWPERATAWDVKVFDEAGQKVVINFIAILEQLSRRTLEAMSNARIKPRGLRSVMEVVTVLGAYIPAETVANLSANARIDRAPAIGATAERKP